MAFSDERAVRPRICLDQLDRCGTERITYRMVIQQQTHPHQRVLRSQRRRIGAMGGQEPYNPRHVKEREPWRRRDGQATVHLSHLGVLSSVCLWHVFERTSDTFSMSTEEGSVYRRPSDHFDNRAFPHRQYTGGRLTHVLVSAPALSGLSIKDQTLCRDPCQQTRSS